MDDSFLRNPRIKHILHLLQEEGIDDITIECTQCINSYGRFMKGFFSTNPTKITLCNDTIESQTEMETVLIHELTHLLDYSRGNEMNTAEEILLTEYRAAYYGDCYDSNPSISLKKKSCIINRGKMNAKNVTSIKNLPFKSIFEQCLYSIEQDQIKLKTNNKRSPEIHIVFTVC